MIDEAKLLKWMNEHKEWKATGEFKLPVARVAIAVVSYDDLRKAIESGILAPNVEGVI
jgi:hypothetical protein